MRRLPSQPVRYSRQNIEPKSHSRDFGEKNTRHFRKDPIKRVRYVHVEATPTMEEIAAQA